MAVINDNRPFSQRYIKFECGCGRKLRASSEHVGSSLRCWDCQQPVSVPVPRYPARTARVLTVGLRHVLCPGGLFWIAGVALLFTLALLLPVPQPVLAALVLAGVAFAYGELVRRWGLAGPLGGDTGHRSPRAYLARAAATLAVALVLTNAWEFGRAWLGFDLSLFREALAVVAALSLGFPLAMLTVWAAPRPRQSLAAVARHPVAMIAALMVVPLALVVGEAVIVFATSTSGFFTMYVFDLLPDAVELAPKFGIPTMGNYTNVFYPDETQFALYAHHLTHGRSLTMALPASLMNPSTLYLRPWTFETTEGQYLLIRVFHTWIIAVVWLTALTVQARCLALLARLWDWQLPRPAPAPAVEPVDEITGSLPAPERVAVTGSGDAEQEQEQDQDQETEVSDEVEAVTV